MSYAIVGKYGGRLELTSKHYESDEEYTINVASKYFDFSNNNELFLGGTFSMSGTIGRDQGICNANGIINFAGKYQGKVVFDNLGFDIDGFSVTSGDLSFYVESKGAKIPLPDYLFLEILDYYNQEEEYEDSDDPITVTKPDIPTAPTGKLSNRDGANVIVDKSNIDEFFNVYLSESYSSAYRAARGEEETYKIEDLRHGGESGYRIWKMEGIEQEYKGGSFYSKTETVEFHDYSNIGVLYVGGGYGMAVFRHYDYSSDSYSSESREAVIHGTIRFNGEFSGTLGFDNFRYRENSERGESEYTYISGSVKIGELDVTDECLEYVIRMVDW